MALKCVWLLLLVALTSVAAREIKVPVHNKPPRRLAAPLEASGGGLVECWNALVELKSCSNEIILFFLNGGTSLGVDCCRAVGIITRHCWPAMLTSLGFTAEEGNILRGYCDAAVVDVAPVGSPTQFSLMGAAGSKKV